MGEKRDDSKLPVLGAFFGSAAASDGPPSLAEARHSLGGPWLGAADVGRLVHVAGGARPFGVVVHGGPDDRDVWIAAGRIQRVAIDRVSPAEPRADLQSVSDDALVHASLHEGQTVDFVRRDGTVGRGRLAEKLRYGGLVGLDDGRVLAISFRSLSPADTEERG